LQLAVLWVGEGGMPRYQQCSIARLARQERWPDWYNLAMFCSKPVRWGATLVLALLLGLLLSACGSSGDEAGEETAQPSSTATLTLYQTPTATAIQTLAVPTFEPTLPPLPTPTPFLYSVAADDTMWGLAIRFNVSLDDLLTANPGVDPSFLSVGTQLVIPIEGSETALPSPTPVTLELPAPLCYPTTAGGLWCFAQVENVLTEALENLTALIHLYSETGELLLSQEANALLNVLYPGQAIPLMTYFDPPLPDWAHSQAQLQTALTVSSEDQRYLLLTMQDLAVQISADGLSADVGGSVSLPEESEPANVVWVALVAYDAQDRVVGLRRWEFEGELAAATPLAFEARVYSLSAAIARVEVLTEARP